MIRCIFLVQQRILFHINRIAQLVLYQQDDNSKYIECAKKLHSVPIIVLFPHILPHYFCHNCTAGSRICGSFEIVLIKTDTNMGSHVNGFLIKIMHYFGWTCLEQFILFYSKKPMNSRRHLQLCQLQLIPAASTLTG